MTKAIVIYLDGDKDLYAQGCESIEEAKEFVEGIVDAAFIIYGDNLNVEDYT